MKRRWLAPVILAVAISPLIVISFLSPQTNAGVYVWQCYFLCRGEPISGADIECEADRGKDRSLSRKIPPPAGYTGRWRVWDSQVRLVSDTGYQNGKMHGLGYYYFHPKRKLAAVILYRNGKELDLVEGYDQEGKKTDLHEYDLTTFLPHGNWVRTVGEITYQSRYEQGVVQGTPYVDDVPAPGFSGIWTTYDNSGSVWGKSLYTDGACRMRVWFSDGNNVKLIRIDDSRYRYLQLRDGSGGYIKNILTLDENGNPVPAENCNAVMGESELQSKRTKVLEPLKEMDLKPLGVQIIEKDGQLDLIALPLESKTAEGEQTGVQPAPVESTPAPAPAPAE